MLVAFSDLLFGGRELAVRRAHAKWLCLRKRNFRSGSANSIVVRRAHARWSRLTEEIFVQDLRTL